MAGSITISSITLDSDNLFSIKSNTGSTNITFPTTGTLVTLDGTETLTNKTLSSPTLTSVTLSSPTLTAPALGTPTSGVATNLTGLPLTTGVTGTLPIANGGTGQTTLAAANIATYTGTETLTNKTLTSPTLTTPVLGTPSSGTLSSCTVDGTNKVGYLNIPNSGAKTSSYTLVIGDVGKFIELGTSGTVVVPASVFAAGDAISIFNNTSATISCTCSAVTTVYKGGTDADISTFSVTTRGVVTILFISATVAVVTGNLA